MASPSKAKTPAQSSPDFDLSRLYVHLNRITVFHQREILSAFGLAKNGTKKTRAARLFVAISKLMQREDRTAIQVLEEKAISKGKDFTTEWNRTWQLWGDEQEATVVPPIQQLEEACGLRQHPTPLRGTTRERPAKLANRSIVDTITLEEFGRLLIFVRSVFDLSVQQRASKPPRLEEIEEDVNQNQLWTNMQHMFNDPTFQPTERLDAPFARLDFRKKPSRQSASVLRDIFVNFRSEFAEIYARWNAESGNDPSKFANFCRRSNRSTLSNSGPRCLMAWKIFKFGTSRQNDLLLQYCSKTSRAYAPPENGNQRENGNQHERGGQNEDGANNERGRNLSPGENTNGAHASRQKRMFEEDGNEIRSRKRKREFDALTVRNARLEHEKTLMKHVVRANGLMNLYEKDKRIGNLVQAYFKRLVNSLEQTMKSNDMQD